MSQIYRVKEGKRSINQKFIIGAKLAFPSYGLDELFYLELDGDRACAAYPDGNHAKKRAELVTSRYLHIVKCFMESA